MLEEDVEDVEAEAVDAAGEPRPDHRRAAAASTAGCRQSRSGCCREEGVVVELRRAAARTSRPGRRTTTPSRSAAAGGPPGRRRPDRATGTSRRGRRSVTRPESTNHAMLVAGVVEDEIHDHPDPAAVGLVDEPVEVRLAPEQRVDGGVVADVVAAVATRRRIDRREPDGVDREPVRAEVVEVVDEPGEVADAVAVRVGEAPRIDLVHDPAAPPVGPEAERRMACRPAGGQSPGDLPGRRGDRRSRRIA